MRADESDRRNHIFSVYLQTVTDVYYLSNVVNLQYIWGEHLSGAAIVFCTLLAVEFVV